MNTMKTPETVAVLIYHSIAATATPSYAKLTVDPIQFEEHLAALREQSIDVILFGEVPTALAAGRHAVAITIDDGLANAADVAAPTLLRHGLSATLFVPSGFVGTSTSWLRGDDGMQPTMSWAAITELAQAGFEIGSHGKFHLAADVNSPELIRDDAAASKAELEQRLGKSVSSFAYPYGYYTRRARRAVREVGFAQACVVNDLPAQTRDDRWMLPRLLVTNETSPEALVSMVGWQPKAVARCWVHMKQEIWRGGRRLGTGWGPPEARRLEAMPR
jgi:peptidoglycan/xylan/chitin deacetylase (PgdA/CDA1 family)